MISLKPSTIAILAGAGVLLAVLAARRGAQAVSATASAVGTALNPNSQDNLAYRAVTAVGSTVAADSSWTLGGWLAGVTGADRDREVREMLNPSAPTPRPISDPLASAVMTDQVGTSLQLWA